MPFIKSNNPAVVIAELKDFARLTKLAIEGKMTETDFAQLANLFEGVKKADYHEYMNGLLEQLSDENLHKLVGGLLRQNAQGAAEGTFLKEDSLARSLLLA